ncbi:ATP-binding cassette sub-family A member 3-like protein [Dinothrombium tinctorium]|uniref:ATP-binding cassette sub-family A member 3-like protein n=1 Tax=Dinothrombium tinctorium TaxID=1965070 RepID=A0A443RPF0_9ACAR|nr:ATP-binding cassette sub-family A member 3-like protein [Dinothrombium tinctorium]
MIEGSAYEAGLDYYPNASKYTFYWSNIFNVPPDYQFLTPGMIIFAMILSVFVWLFILIYFNQTKHWKAKIIKRVLKSIGRLKESDECYAKDSQYFEPDPIHLKVGIVIRQLTKEYSSQKVAVKNINLNLYYGQITVLLGHNGAGKTTLMNMITGMCEATKGDVFINEFNIREQTKQALSTVGLCPQKSILWENLTVKEHFYIFGLLKRGSAKNIDLEIERLLALLNLSEQKDVIVNKLSGGMRRRVQLGIAIVGGCNILILDEPSSGLDVEARRMIWDLLLSIRKDYLIFMTTHHMEEADCLGDRIAIMLNSEIQCCGSSQFLKRIFDVGYRLRILKKQISEAKSTIDIFINDRLNKVKFENETSNELVYSFPQAESSKVANFFKELDDKSETLGIESYGINITSLDDVFLRSARLFKEPLSMEIDSSLAFKLSRRSDANSTARLIYTLLEKRFLINKRVWPLLILFLISSAFFTASSLGIIYYETDAKVAFSEEWRRKVDPSDMGYIDAIGFCSSKDAIKNKGLIANRTDEGKDIFCDNLVRTAKDFSLTVDKTYMDAFNYARHASKSDYFNFREKMIVGVSSQKVKDLNVVAHFNAKALHSLPITINLVFNTLFKMNTNNSDAQIETWLHPVHKTKAWLCNLISPESAFKVCCKEQCNECYTLGYNPFAFESWAVLADIWSLLFILVGTITAIIYLDRLSTIKEEEPRIPPINVEDTDVTDERERIDNIITENKVKEEAFVCDKLSKVFKNFTAVNRLSFVVHKDEVFGFLGANGAGKTTTFRMLVGDLLPSLGNAFISSFSLRKNLFQYRQQIGYSPQKDALIDHLTSREMLEFYANIRGVPKNELHSTVKQMLYLTDLEKYSDIVANNYSGGNKRKLSLAIAMIGCPAVILLDEPTSGVDPLARRKMWQAIEVYKKVCKGSVILSSHSMDECEALCNRIAILIKGRLQCIGSIQHLKSKFRQGFIVYMKTSKKTDSQMLQKYIKQKFINAFCKDMHPPHITFQIQELNVSLASIFEEMEQIKDLFQLEDYHITQTSLEQLFLSLSQGTYTTKSTK